MGVGGGGGGGTTPVTVAPTHSSRPKDLFFSVGDLIFLAWVLPDMATCCWWCTLNSTDVVDFFVFVIFFSR